MKVLVTGAAGFIGYHVSRALLDRGNEVVGFDNLNPYYDPSLKEARLALLAPRTVSRCSGATSSMPARCVPPSTGSPDRVVHLAAQAGVRYSLVNPQAYVDANVTGTLNVLEGCRHRAPTTSYTLRPAPSMGRTRPCRSRSTTA